MITESNERAAARSKLNARRWAMLGIVAAIAIFAFGYYKYQSQAREARRQPIIREIGRLEAAERSADKLSDEHDAILGKYDTARKAASTASQARHDNALSSNPSTQTKLDYAEQESANVGKLSDLSDQYADVFNRYANAMDDVLGGDAVSRFRADAQTYTSELSVSLSDWGRAIDGIKDSLKEQQNGGFGGGDRDTEREYQQSDEEENRADKSETQLINDWKKLKTQLDGRLHNARVALGNA